MRRIWPVLLAIWLGMAGTVRAAEYAGLSLNTFGISGSRLTLGVDQEILIPSLQQTPLQAEMLPLLVPYWGRPEVEDIMKSLQGMQGLSLGHAAPYFYAATTHALS